MDTTRLYEAVEGYVEDFLEDNGGVIEPEDKQSFIEGLVFQLLQDLGYEPDDLNEGREYDDDEDIIDLHP